MQAQSLTIEEVDTLTGTPLGWPKTGTFRLGDMVGVDVMAHVAKNFAAQAAKIGDERADVGMPPFIGMMLEKQMARRQGQAGLLQKRRQGRRRPRSAPRSRLADARLQAQPAPQISRASRWRRTSSTRLRASRSFSTATPRRTKPPPSTGRFLTELFTYSANRVPEIADNIVEIDHGHEDRLQLGARPVRDVRRRRRPHHHGKDARRRSPHRS